MRKLVVILDPAHGSDVAGKCSPDGTHKEYQWSRKVCNMLEDALLEKDFRVEFTNVYESEIGLSKRKQFASDLIVDADQIKLLVSLHNNAAGNGNKFMSARGFEIYTSVGKTKSDEFAEIIMKNLMIDFPTLMGFKHRVDRSDGDLDKEANFTVLMGAGYSAILLEWLFQDNKEDLAKLKDENTNRKLVSSLVKSLIQIDDQIGHIK